jgi:hypothetical protein
MVFGKHARVVEQPPEQGAFAIVHAAAGDEAQHSVCIRCHHQK